MATMTMTASFLGGGGGSTTKNLPTTARRGGAMAVRASRDSEKMVVNAKGESNNTRRDLMFAMAAAAASAVTKVAMAKEPKPGSPEAKEKHAPVCVTMPTARICRN